LLELLVVIAIIGIMASIIIVPLSNARAKSRDARRLSDQKQIQLALELYYNTNGRYPQRGEAQSGPENVGCGVNWCNLANDLALYISSLPNDPLGLQTAYRYFYDADSGDNYQTYGLMVKMESSSNYPLAANDGGHSTYAIYFEVGQQPRYCMEQYGGMGGNNGYWWNVTNPNLVCLGGN